MDRLAWHIPFYRQHAGTNRDLREAVRAGRFRDDVLARINHWTFRLPPLRERPEDTEPNVDYELKRYTRVASATVRFNAEARRAYLRFATAPEAWWTSIFHELSASITRMATLSDGGRITERLVNDEIKRLQSNWQESSVNALDGLLTAPVLDQMDTFDRLQLESVIQVCRRNRTIADAGRALFGASRTKRSTTNDSDRLRKFLQRFGLSWEAVTSNSFSNKGLRSNATP